MFSINHGETSTIHYRPNQVKRAEIALGIGYQEGWLTTPENRIKPCRFTRKYKND